MNTGCSVTLTVNGRERSVSIDIRQTLLDLLRDNLGLTGTKRGCDEGACGACTVLMNGKSVSSCMVLAVDAEGAEILTIEGLNARAGEQFHPGHVGQAVHPIQQAFVDTGAVQCGFCTPGMVLSAKALLDKNPDPTAQEIREGLSGNLCRCTGYRKIVEAVGTAARLLRSPESGNGKLP